MTEAHLTIVLAQDQATHNDPRRAHAVHKDFVDAVLRQDLAEVHRSLVVHTMDSAAALVELLGAPVGG